MEFDDLLTNHIGPFGRFQALCFLGYAFHALPYYLGVIECVYQGVIPKHHCKDSPNDRVTIPRNNGTSNDVINITDEKFAPTVEHQCYVKKHNWDNTSKDGLEDLHYGGRKGTSNASHLVTEMMVPCKHLAFENEQFGKTIVEQVECTTCSVIYCGVPGSQGLITWKLYTPARTAPRHPNL